MPHQRLMRRHELTQRRVDRVEIDVGDEAVDGGIDAARLRTKQKSSRRKQVRQNPQVGDSPGVGSFGLIASDTLEVVPLEVVLSRRL